MINNEEFHDTLFKLQNAKNRKTTVKSKAITRTNFCEIQINEEKKLKNTYEFYQ